ncbi:unnamed protein product, partial [Larinioides sclopetarius]
CVCVCAEKNFFNIHFQTILIIKLITIEDHPAVIYMLKNCTEEYYQVRNATEITFFVPLGGNLTGVTEMSQHLINNCPSLNRANFRFH